MNMAVVFKKGMYTFNDQSNFNYQLNRLVMWDGGAAEEIQKIGPKIHTSEDWKRELINLGDKAIAEKRTENAVAYYRMSEFFMYDGDPDKKKYYKLATELFYDYYKEWFTDDRVERLTVPYEDIALPVMHVKPISADNGKRTGAQPKDVILLHGGNDSYFEELFFPMLYLAENGFEVYLFEGPGQGGVMRLLGKHFTYEWERPVKAVLDALHLCDVTIIGASLGGMLAPRAAAFEKRISRVIAWSIFPNFQNVLLAASQGVGSMQYRLAKKLIAMHCRGIVNLLFQKKAKKDEMIRWGLEHGKYAYEAKDAYEYATNMSHYQMLDIADKITQDVLIVGANQDHFIPYEMIGEEINALKNVHSLTFRLFTDKESAGNHCNCGNSKLVFDTFINWIIQTKRGD